MERNEKNNIVKMTEEQSNRLYEFFPMEYARNNRHYLIRTPTGDIECREDFYDAVELTYQYLIDDFENRTNDITPQQKIKLVEKFIDHLHEKIKNSGERYDAYINHGREISIRANLKFIDYLEGQSLLDNMELDNNYFKIYQRLIIIKKNQNLVLAAIKELFEDDYDRIVEQCRIDKGGLRGINKSTAKKGKELEEREKYKDRIEYKEIKKLIESSRDLILKIAYLNK